jgi:hypothetical protein
LVLTLAQGAPRHVHSLARLAVSLLVGLAAISSARAEPVRGEATFSAGGGP